MKKHTHFHFLGICGTAMGAVASAIAQKGHVVTGSDENVYPPMSTFLEKEGITIFKGYQPENIPAEADYIIVGNAISRGNKEVEAVLNRKLRYLSLPETMKEFFLGDKRNFVVTGTHGKTTTSSLLTWLMEDFGLDPSFMIGGIAKNLNRGGRFTDSQFTVLEGDEYDTAFFDKRSKFLHYLPELVIINNIEFDHADIYNNLEEIKLSFRRLINLVPGNGLVVVNGDDPNCLDVITPEPGKKLFTQVETIGFGEKCDLRIEHVRYTPEGSYFELRGEAFFIPMLGEFNVRNAAMAARAAKFANIPAEAIAESMKNFLGVARRQELRGEADGVKVIDDFAHHPTAISEAIKGMRQKYPDSRLWVVFEPRSNTTRRKVFQAPLADSLALADVAVISLVEDISKVKNPADRLDVNQLVEDITQKGTRALLGKTVFEIITAVAAEAASGDVVVIMSNGGFGGIHEKLLEALRNRKN